MLMPYSRMNVQFIIMKMLLDDAVNSKRNLLMM